jgi:uncharacterized protein YkwD
VRRGTVRNWRTSIRSPYAAALLVVALAAWVALPQLPEENPLATTTAAVTDAEKLNPPDLKRASDIIVAMTNEFREGQGLEPVEVNVKLANTASYFADYMAGTDAYSHTADGKTPSDRAREHGYDYCLVSENIAYLYSSADFITEELAEKMVEGWTQSPEHRKNMLDPAVTEIGVAVAHSSTTGNYYGVQLFGRPKSLTIRVAIENKSEVPIEYTVGERTYKLPSRNRRTHEECLPTDITFYLPGESKPVRHDFRPQNGDQYIISGRADRLKIEKK